MAGAKLGDVQVDFSPKSGIPGAKETILIGDLCGSGVAGKRTRGTLHRVLGYVLGASVGDAEVDEDSSEDLLEVAEVTDSSKFRRIVGLVARAVPCRTGRGRSRAVASARHAMLFWGCGPVGSKRGSGSSEQLELVT